MAGWRRNMQIILLNYIQYTVEESIRRRYPRGLTGFEVNEKS